MVLGRFGLHEGDELLEPDAARVVEVHLPTEGVLICTLAAVDLMQDCTSLTMSAASRVVSCIPSAAMRATNSSTSMSPLV